MTDVDLRELLESRILRLRGVERRKSRFGDRLAYAVDGIEFVHFHSGRELDVRLTRRFQRLGAGMLGRDARIGFRKGKSEWVTLTVATGADVDFAFQLVRLAWEANRKR